MLSLAACQQPIDVGIPAPPQERLTCQELPMPSGDIKRLEAFAAGDGIAAYPKGEVDARDALVAAWILAMRDVHFVCYDNLAWLRGYYEAQE